MSEFISSDQKAEYKGVFDLFDKQKRGFIDFDSLKAGMIAMRLHPKDEEVKAMLKEANVSGNGKIDFVEFCGVLSRKLGKMDREADILKAFNTFDRNDKGTIQSEELRKALTTLGDKLSDKEVRAVLAEGSNEEGQFDYESFVRKMVGKEELKTKD